MKNEKVITRKRYSGDEIKVIKDMILSRKPVQEITLEVADLTGRTREAVYHMIKRLMGIDSSIPLPRKYRSAAEEIKGIILPGMEKDVPEEVIKKASEPRVENPAREKQAVKELIMMSGITIEFDRGKRPSRIDLFDDRLVIYN